MDDLQAHLNQLNKDIALRQPLIDTAESVIRANGFLYARFFNDGLATPGHYKSIGGRLIKFWKLKKKINKNFCARSPAGVVKRINRAFKDAGLGRYRAITHATIDDNAEVIVFSIIITDREAKVKSC